MRYWRLRRFVLGSAQFAYYFVFLLCYFARCFFGGGGVLFCCVLFCFVFVVFFSFLFFPRPSSCTLILPGQRYGLCFPLCLRAVSWNRCWTDAFLFVSSQLCCWKKPFRVPDSTHHSLLEWQTLYSFATIVILRWIRRVHRGC